VKERPILFSAPMVRALLVGTKTQTRRIVKPQPTSSSLTKREHPTGVTYWTSSDFSEVWECPYGRPGDRLWVKETFQNGLPLPDGSNIPHYRADRDQAQLDAYSGTWRPSIFMPRWASRITLEIVRVRVERLQEISAEDAIAEGIEPHEHIGWKHYGRESAPFQPQMTERGSYMTLWESINGAGSWAAIKQRYTMVMS